MQVPFGIRGVNPESNINLINDMALLESKKDKCIEIFKTSGSIHELLQKAKGDVHLQRGGISLDLNNIISLMFSDKHFVNCKS